MLSRSSVPGMTRVRALILVAILAMVAGACRVDVTVDIDVNEDGSGLVSVTLVADAEAVALSPDLPDNLQLHDLPGAGWAVTGPAGFFTGRRDTMGFSTEKGSGVRRSGWSGSVV